MPVTGREGLRAVNLARMLQGLGWTRTPPTVTTMGADDDVLAVVSYEAPAPAWPLLVHVGLRWTRTAGATAPAYCLMVWGSAGRSWGVGQAFVRGLAWRGCASVVVGDLVNIDGLLMGSPSLVAGGLVNLCVGVAEVGLPPFFRRRISFRNRGL